jgi:hypothetical protein
VTRSQCLLALGVTVLGLTALPQAAAAPPPNDTRANAQRLEIPAQVVGTTVDATADPADPQCQPRVRESVWYRFSRTTPGPILVSLVSAGQLDAVVAVYELDKNQLKLLRCEATDATGRTLFSLESNPKPKTTVEYFLLVGQRLNSDPGSFTLAITAPERPTNDERPGATQLDKLPAAVAGTTIGATSDDGDPDCAEGGPTVWYRLETVQKSRVSIRLHATGNLDATVCAVLRVRSQLRDVGADNTDDRGNAALQFDASARATYYLVVTQAPKSEPGTFQLTATSPPRPANDERVQAVTIGSVPATLRGTTLGATHDLGDPDCAIGAPTVWYRLGWNRSSRVVVRFHAGGNLDAQVCVFEVLGKTAPKAAQRLRAVADAETDERDNAAFDFEGRVGATYYVVVSQLTETSPGPFSLTVLRPDEFPAAPGDPLPIAGGRGHFDPLLNPEDAWAVPLRKGATYRFSLVTKPDECVSIAVYSPRATDFEEDAPAKDFTCAETEFFTPGPDGGGIHPVLVTAEDDATTYRLFVRRVQPDDTGPGVLLENGRRARGSVSGADPLDLYRFDVPRKSNVQVEVSARRDLGIRLLNADGRTVKRGEPNDKIVRVLDTGTYYVALSPDEKAARYTLRVLVRYVTTTRVTVDGSSSAKTRPGVAVSIRTTTDPEPGPGVTRVQVDFFDVATETWVFRQLWDVSPGATISFVPDAVGRWRVRATFGGNRVASRSRSGYGIIVVSTV